MEQLWRLHGRRAGGANDRVFPVRFFNLLSPLISLIYGLTGFHIERIDPTGSRSRRQPAPRATRRWRRPKPKEDPHDRRREAQAAPRREKKRGFALPSAYTILFILIVVVAIADLDHPGRQLRLRRRWLARSRAPTTASTRTRPGSSSTRSTAPINGMYGIEGEDGSISYYNCGDAVRRDRRRPVHPGHRRLPRRHDADRRDPGRHRRRRRSGCGAASSA